MQMPNKRLLIKLSGESLSGKEPTGIDAEASLSLAKSLQEIINTGHELAIVIGGGNIFRGVDLHRIGMQRTPADQMGMLSTLINGIALQQALQSLGSDARLMSALECPKVAENYNWRNAQDYLSAGKPVIFVGGTGSPYFTTDTAAALRASEMKADLLIKATKVDGVYSSDPIKNKDAKRYSKISYTQYLAEGLLVMDATSVALCMSSKIPIFVFSMNQLGKTSIGAILANQEKFGTLIS